MSENVKSQTILDPETKTNFPPIVDLLYFVPNNCPNNITELDREWRMLRNVNLIFNQTQNSRYYRLLET